LEEIALKLNLKITAEKIHTRCVKCNGDIENITHEEAQNYIKIK